MSSFLFSDCRCGENVDRSMVWTLFIWVAALLGWNLLLRMEDSPPWLATGGALTVIGGLLVVAKRLIPDEGTAIASWLILAMGLMIPIVLQGMAGLETFPRNAIFAPAFMFLPVAGRRDQQPAVFLISSVIGAFALGVAPLI